MRKPPPMSILCSYVILCIKLCLMHIDVKESFVYTPAPHDSWFDYFKSSWKKAASNACCKFPSTVVSFAWASVTAEANKGPFGLIGKWHFSSCCYYYMQCTSVICGGCYPLYYTTPLHIYIYIYKNFVYIKFIMLPLKYWCRLFPKECRLALQRCSTDSQQVVYVSFYLIYF